MAKKKPRYRPIEIYKFGGVAVGNPDAVRAAIERVRAAPDQVVVVVSATQGITDLILRSAEDALRRDDAACEKAASLLASRHAALIDELVRGKRRAGELMALLSESVHEMRSMTESIGVLRELTPRARDALVARGERLMAQIFAAALNEAKVASTFVDATQLILTEHRLGSLWPDFRKCQKAAEKTILPLLDDGQVVVVPGFLGAGPDGEVVTLGRGGTDFSAGILARSLGARSVSLFKEVDGLMTADPRMVPSARRIDELHYREAAELAYYGARILHPRTMIPLIERGIPLHIRNAFHEQAGTRIASDVEPGEYPVKALTAIHDQAMISIEGNGMMGVPGVAGRAFTALSDAGHSVAMISQASSESSICVVLPAPEADHAVAALESAFETERRLKLIDRIRAEKQIALIAVVGLGMRHRPGIAARTFSALSSEGINVIAIAQGSSELNITVAISEPDAERALQALHDEYQLDKLRPLADTSGREAKLTFLGFGQIGRTLAGQLVAQQTHHEKELGIDLEVTAIADRSGIRIEEKGFTSSSLRKLTRHKASGGKLFDRSSPITLQQLQEMMREELWILPSHRPILVDLTSDETAPLIQEALEQGFHIVLANKKPLTVPQLEYDRLIQTARDRRLSLRYEATAGAGLPVLDTLTKLQDAGDRVDRILGCFSGTLGYLMTAVEDGARFSAAVEEAWKKGYTEPDPRDDLSGMDVARKALILARALGMRAELSDIRLEPLFDDDVDDPDPATFVKNLAALDDEFAKRAATAAKKDKVLRYVAKISRRSIRVGIEAVPVSSPMGRLRGTDNQLAIYSRRYRENPLVVTGPGAGAEVTAAGVLNDIVAITMEERRKKR